MGPLSLLVVLPGGLKSRAAGRQSPITNYQSPARTCSIKSSLTYVLAAQVFVRCMLLLYCAFDFDSRISRRSVTMSGYTHPEVVTLDSDEDAIPPSPAISRRSSRISVLMVHC